VSVLSVRGAIVANLFSSGAVEYFVRIIRIAKQTLIQAVVPSANKVVTQGDVHEEIDVLCNLNVEDLEISAPFASTREHVLVFGGITGTYYSFVPEVKKKSPKLKTCEARRQDSANSFVLGTAVINTHIPHGLQLDRTLCTRSCSNKPLSFRRAIGLVHTGLGTQASARRLS
jgi:hypothetical protein